MEFLVLGPLEVWSKGTRIALPSTRHQRLVGALLLTPNAVVPVVKLIAALWDEQPPATATKQVQNCVSTLRRRLGPAGDELIVTDGTGYRLAVTEDQLDLLRFRRDLAVAHRLAAAGRLTGALTTARAALRLWRGPALDGICTAVLANRAASLNAQRLNAIEQCIDWQLALGQHRAATDELAELIAENPLRERLHEQLMLALDRGGRPAEALMVFHQLRERLATELGIDPGTPAQAQYMRILRGEPETAGEHRGTTAAKTPPGDTERPVAPAPSRLDRAGRDLATAVTRQWTAEIELRSLNRPRPVRVTWSATTRPVTTELARDDARRGDAPEHGDLSDAVTKFRKTPTRQLVVLGEPGAGKTVTAMVLTLNLLSGVQPEEPVAVLLSLASWHPRTEHLHSWLACTLLAEYPWLHNTATYGRDAATRLVLDGRILPVLDGLDELPPDHHAAAIDALDQAVAGGHPLIVTCRGADYERAVRHSGAIIAGAAVVELEPVEPDAALRFLTAREPMGTARWRPVAEHLRRHPAGPLARTLRTPLMVDLARAAYGDPASDPAELCDPVRFADQAEYEEHLLDAYLPATYAQRPPPPAQRRGTATDPGQAHRWLAFLARQLRQVRSPNLAWWQLDRAVPRHVAWLLLGLPPTVPFAVAGMLAGGPAVGLVYGVSFALAGVSAHAFGHRPAPRRVEVKFRGTAVRFLSRCAVGVAVGVGLGLGWSLSPGIVVLLAAVFALAIGSHAWLDVPVDASRDPSPNTVLRNDRIAALWFAGSFGLSLGVFYGVAFAFTSEIRFVAIWGGRFDLVLALAAGLAAALLGRYLMGRAGTVAYGVAGAAAGGLVFPRAAILATALPVGLLFGVAVGLAVYLSRASGVFAASRIWLAARGHAPRRLMHFLDDAHRRGVLRQAGAVYQFRHARLVDRLAAPSSGIVER